MKEDLPSKNQELYINHLAECASLDISALNIAALIIESRRKLIGNKLGTALLNNDNSAIQKYREEYDKIEDVKEEDEQEEEYNNVSVASVVEDVTNKDNIIKLFPKELDKAVKSKTKTGHHILIFARPEMGKTAVTLTLAANFCFQGLDTIIFGNEEPVRDTILRAQCCFTGMTEEEIVANPGKAQAILDKHNWRRLRFIPLSPGSPRDIEKYVSMYKPGAFFVDQIRNLNVGAETRVNQLEMAAVGVRNIAKKYNAIGVSITQAGDSATNKLFLEMGDVDFSNTGIPATADLMIGLGMNDEYEKQGLRGISLPKNKIGGMHHRFAVRIRPDISRLEDM